MGKKSGFKKVLVSFLVLIVIAGGILLAFSRHSLSGLKDSSNIANGHLTEEELKNKVSILLIGADQRPGDDYFNTDTIILATIDPQNARVSLLSIPRDTRVSIPGHENIKINGVAPLTSLDNLVSVVSDFTGIPIAGYMQTNFNGFKKIIDTLGGITVDVEKDMYYETGDEEDGVINLKKGLQRLNGSQALQYARFRNDALGDISRTARQQVVLKAVAKEMLQLSTLPKLPWLIPDLKEAINTNLELGDLFKIARTAIKLNDLEIVTQTLPGRFHDMNGISYWDVDPEEAKLVVSNLLRGITTDKVIGESVIDLLEPVESGEEVELPLVPGGEGDPNGQESPDYHTINPEDPQSEEKIPEEPQTEEPNSEGPRPGEPNSEGSQSGGSNSEGSQSEEPDSGDSQPEESNTEESQSELPMETE